MKIAFWIATSLIFLAEGVMPAIYGNSEMAKMGIAHLGYPGYFGVMLNIFKIAGALALILPFVPKRIKEWAYAGFTFNFISASVSHGAVDGFGMEAILPIIALAILALSYFAYHKTYGKTA